MSVNPEALQLTSGERLLGGRLVVDLALDLGLGLVPRLVAVIVRREERERDVGRSAASSCR